MKRYLIEFDNTSIIKKFKEFDEVMAYCRKLHDALEIPIRFFPLVDNNAVIIDKTKQNETKI